MLLLTFAGKCIETLFSETVLTDDCRSLIAPFFCAVYLMAFGPVRDYE